MTVIPMHPGAEARALLHHILEHGEIVGRDTIGHSIIQLAVDDWTLDKLLTLYVDSADMENGGDDEPDDDAEEGGPAGAARGEASDAGAAVARPLTPRPSGRADRTDDHQPVSVEHFGVSSFPALSGRHVSGRGL